MNRGTEIYYTGDQANRSGFGEVSKVWTDGRQSYADITFSDGRVFRANPTQTISSNYDGTGRHRLVLRDAYNAYRQEVFKRLENN